MTMTVNSLHNSRNRYEIRKLGLRVLTILIKKNRIMID